MIISHVSLDVIAKIHEIVCTVQRIKKNDETTWHYTLRAIMGMALAYIHPIGALNNERQRRVDRTNRLQNDYKSSIKRPALICFKKTETVQSI